MEKLLIFGVLFMILASNLKSEEAVLKDEKSYYQSILDEFKNAYTLCASFKLRSGEPFPELYDKEMLSLWGKNKEEISDDSIELNTAIKSFYLCNFKMILYLKQYNNDTSIIPYFVHFSGINVLLCSNYETYYKPLLNYYNKKKNAYLDLILNYYINTDHTTIKLLLNSFYIEENSITTEELYKRLDKIFQKYSYEDKEKIRNAILKDFGKCIDQCQMTNK